VLTAALVLVTAVYAYLTYGIMKATRRSVEAMKLQTESLTRPYVTISPMTIPGNPILFLRVSNSGRTAAERLRLRMEKPFYQFGHGGKEEENLQNLSAFTDEIASLAPGSELVFALGQSFVVFGAKADEAITPLVFNVFAHYSFAGRTVEESTEVDLRPYLGMHLSYDPVVSQLEGIKKVLEKWVKKA